MQLNFTIDPQQDTARELNALSDFLLSLTGKIPAPEVQAFFGTSGETKGKSSGETGEIASPTNTAAAGEPEPVVEVVEDEPVKAPAKKAAPKAKAAKAKEPEPEPEVEIVDEEEEGPDYGKLRLEIRTRFANWAEQVGMIEGKALLDSFNVGKFSELDNSQLKAFSNKLAVMEADL